MVTTYLLVAPGFDTLLGGNGNDMLWGGETRKGQRLQMLDGGNGRDVLVSGEFQQEASADALTKLLAEWTRSDFVYNASVSNLQNGTGLNAPVVLNGSTVHANAIRSSLIGGKGQNWYLSGAADRLSKRGVTSRVRRTQRRKHW